MALLSPLPQEKAPTHKPPCERTVRAYRRSFLAHISWKFLVEQRHFRPCAPGCQTLNIRWKKEGSQTTPTTAEVSVASAVGSPPSTGTTVDMGRSAVTPESCEVVGLSAMNESGQAERVSEPTVAEAVVGVGVLDGDTQANAGQAEEPLVVC